MSASACKKAAERISSIWKDVATGSITRKQAEEALKAIPNLPPRVLNAALDRVVALAVVDGNNNMPSVRQYLDTFVGDATPSSEAQRKGIFSRFLTYLGAKADKRLDAVTPDICRAFCRHELERVSVGTVRHYLNYLSAAFNRAVHDEFLNRNPFSRMELAKMSISVNPELGQDKTERQPFTPEEINLLCTSIAAPWRDMVLISYLTGGQRLGDIACLKWDSIDFERGLVAFTTGKTKKRINAPMTSQLKERLQQLHSQRIDAGYVFPDMASRYQCSRGGLSVEFTSILKALGIVTSDDKNKKGKRRGVAVKSFHSIRHTVVTMLRASQDISADLSRAIVGHDSEVIERAYFTAPEESIRKGLELLACAIK